jgi:hypothetical protein
MKILQKNDLKFIEIIDPCLNSYECYTKLD